MSMLIAVFSDTHGALDAAAGAVRRSRPDMIVHLGDFARDAEELSSLFPDIELHAVRGNCDLASRAPLSERFTVGSTQLFASHGHAFGVKSGLAELRRAARAAGADIALFGHTHRPVYLREEGLMLLNPGSAGCSPRPSWALLELGAAGIVSCRILAFP